MNEADFIAAIKKITAILLLIIGIVYMQSVAFAASLAAVYADEVGASPGETVLIPVRSGITPELWDLSLL